MKQLHKRSTYTLAVKLLITAVFLLIGILMLLPFIWMLSASFKNTSELFRYPIEWIRAKPNTGNYEKVWSSAVSFGVYYKNSIKITFFQVLGSLITSSMAGYAFAKLRFRGKETIFLLYLATMIIPAQVFFVPRFILFDSLGMVNTHLAIILPGMFTVLGTFIMRQFFGTLPGELMEAAKVDGVGHWRMFWQICLPLTKPALVTLLILTFTWHWNEYENPLILLRDRDLFTIPLGLTTFTDENGTDYPLIMAASVSALAPLVLVVTIFQRWFVEGIASTGLKG